jgi:hypothetical protein
MVEVLAGCRAFPAVWGGQPHWARQRKMRKPEGRLPEGQLEDLGYRTGLVTPDKLLQKRRSFYAKSDFLSTNFLKNFK